MRTYTVLSLLVVSCLNVFAQEENPAPQDLHCLEGNFQYLPEDAYDNQCILTVEDAVVNGFEADTPMELRATQIIDITNSDIVPTNGPVHISMGKADNDLEVAWYEPEGTYVVDTYEKVELGLKMPEAINDAVNLFINDPEAEGALNPFDPDDIDVYAVIEREESPGNWVSMKTINGFFYRDYEMNFNLPDYTGTDYGDWDWVEIPTEYRFRVRYAPPVEGAYRCYVYLKSGEETYQSTQVVFYATTSSDPGYVEVASNDKYLQLGGDLFFPVGTNLHTTDRVLDFKETGSCNGESVSTGSITNASGWGLNAWYSQTAHPALFRAQLHDQLMDLAAAGGNMARTISFPYDFEIEFEHLTNYYDRMNCAYEFDEYIELANSLGVKIEWCMMAHYPLEVDQPYGMRHWDWFDDYGYQGAAEENGGYCYHTELGLEDPIEFFTDPSALEAFKKKIRYQIARWGYSTTISIMELMSEINNTGTVNGIAPWSRDNSDVFQRSQYRSAIASWQLEIASYIKGELNHTEHLLASSYLTGGALDSFTDEDGNTSLSIAIYDSTYVANPLLDVVCESRYVSSLVDFAKIAETNSIKYHGDLDYLLPPVFDGFGIEKPIIYSELSFPEATDDGEDFSDCLTYRSSIKYLMLYPFSGIANAGNSWYDFRNPDRTHWEVFGHVQSFMNGIDLHEHDWRAEGDWTQNNDNEVRIAMSSLRTGTHSSGNLRVTGAIYNLSWNEYNFRECQSYNCPEQDIGIQGCDCDELNQSDGEDSWVGFFLDEGNVNGFYDVTSSANVGGENALVLENMGSWNTYFVRYYNPLVGDYCFSSNEGIEHFEVQSNLFGNLALTIPFNLSGEFPVVYFELWDDDLANFRSMQLTSSNSSPSSFVNSIHQEVAVSGGYKDFEIFPNPATDLLHVKGSVEESMEYNIVSSDNRLVMTGELLGSDETLDVSLLASGVYFLRVMHIGEMVHFRFVKV